MLTKREAWLYIADKISRADRVDSHGDLIIDGQYHMFGICDTITRLYDHECIITFETYLEMKQAVHNHPQWEMGQYIWPLNLEGAAKRIEFCRGEASKLLEDQ